MSRKKLYSVGLNEEYREGLSQYFLRGNASVSNLTLARILPLADEGRPDKEIAETLRVSKFTVNWIRKRYYEGDLDFALHEKVRHGAPQGWTERWKHN